MTHLLARFAPQLRSILRIITALLLIEHGTFKLLHFPAPPGGSGPDIPLMSLLGAAGIIEIVGGTLATVGLFSRIAAFILSGEMAFAYFMGHAPSGFFPLLNKGDTAILFCFVFLYLSAAGPGPWSIDAALKRD